MAEALRFRRAKIVCTLGPATNTPEMIDRLVRAGMDVARLNFSHGTHADHARVIAAVRAVSGRYEKPIAILADLRGPKIRTGKLAGGKSVWLRQEDTVVLTTEEVAGDARRISTNYRALPEEVRQGDRILLADGLIELRVSGISRREVRCQVVNSGELREHQGINLPGVKLRTPAFTARDRKDLAFALKHEVDYVAVSFVRWAEDILEVKKAISKGKRETPVIAKIEKPEAIENLDSILEAADGVMVARGDLGVEMSLEKVPVAQKRIIARARDYRVPVITATQMLESMTEHPWPTRAEASDVANAVFDGTDAVMLSGETAVGRYPVESVEMMDRIVREAEASSLEVPRPHRPAELGVSEAISEAVCHAAEELSMRVIAVFTQSGWTARLISQYRPRPPIIAFSPVQETRRRLSLYWGVVPRKIDPVRDIDSLAASAERRLLEEKLVRKGDMVALVAGTPFGVRGTTDFLKLHRIGG